MKVASSSVSSLLINAGQVCGSACARQGIEASSKTPAWQGIDITSGVRLQTLMNFRVIRVLLVHSSLVATKHLPLFRLALGALTASPHVCAVGSSYQSQPTRSWTGATFE